MLTLLIASITASSPDAWVVLSRKAGVNGVKALDAAEAVAKTLDVPTRIPVQDVTVCKGKRACLLEMARKNQVEVLIAVEVAKVLDQGVLHVEAISVEEDGASLGTVDAEGKVDALVKTATPQLKGDLLKRVRLALGLDRPAAVAVVPPPPVSTPTPEPVIVSPPPMPELKTRVEPKRVNLVRLLPGIVGVALLGTGIGLRGAAGGEAEALRSQARMRTLGDLELDAIAQRGSTLQSVGLTGIALGVAGIGASVAWILFGEELYATISPTFGGAMVGVHGVIP